jgi:hypothetical protein
MPEEQEVETFICSCCGDEFVCSEHSESYVIRSERLCEGCWESETSLCEMCGEYGWLDDMTYIEELNGQVCDYCRNEHCTTCPNCESLVVADDMVYVTDTSEYWCDGCSNDLIYCGDCESYFTRGIRFQGETRCAACTRPRVVDVLAGIDETCECRDCTAARRACNEALQECDGTYSASTRASRNRLFSCTECGRGIRGVENIIVERDEDREGLARDPDSYVPHEVFCSNCRMVDGRGRPCYTVRSYSYRPQPMFKGKRNEVQAAMGNAPIGDPKQLFFGVEVEVQSSGKNYTEALADMQELDRERIFYCKSDASIGGGFEVVSHPFSFNWMKENDSSFEALFNLQKYCNAYNARSCGMHVHMSSNAFTALHTYKLLRFFYGNPDFIRRVSRREGDSMDHWASVNLEPSLYMSIAKRRDYNSRRYMALNFQPRRTIECRIFRSTVSRPLFYGNIEFLKAAYDYTKAFGVRDLSVDGFLQYTRKHGKLFHNFLRSFDTLQVDFETEQ